MSTPKLKPLGQSRAKCAAPHGPCKDRIKRMRLSRTDWALVMEALEMLSADYEDEHPCQLRLEALHAYSRMKAYGAISDNTA